ncbi:ElyC/SanA/YdcF family protein [Fusobacterium sp.]|uniref:ElyC/SanA/YdcF family protein n=1 Tax=Fusobacterium sp. TaxID=68766 RepID=UPI00396CF253
MNKFKITTGILAIFALTACSSTKTKINNDYEYYANQAKICDYTQKGMEYYWHGGDLKKAEKEFFKGITLKGKFDVVENYFKQASKLNPDRLDIRFGVASSEIIQGKVAEALDSYREIVRIYPYSYEGNMLLAGYDYATGNIKEYNEIMERYKKTAPEKVIDFEKSIARTEEIKKTKFNTAPFKMNGGKGKKAIVVLGYALGEGGVMQPTLLGRLNQALAQAKDNPDADIIVTGGVPQGGVTEGYVMKNSLVKKGINPERIYVEDQAKDTVGNAIYSIKILDNIGAQDVTLITSASHMRRALAVFEAASKENNSRNLEFTNLVYLDYPTLEDAYKIPEKENLVIYRDMMRAYGFWAYPGIQR